MRGALIVCPYFGNEGFPDLATGFLGEAIASVRRAGGVIIADEVQPGFGRTGSHMWGHQRAGFQPDIATLGKPMGNGHPIGGVVTTAQIQAAFRNAFGYFNTFGGNPVSCAAAMAVLEVLENEDLVANARDVGDYARGRLHGLAETHEVIGDVRGAGLFFGCELVHYRATKSPATAYADRVANEMRVRGVLLNTLGIHLNTLKIRPPMPFGKAEADLMIETLDDVLRSTPIEAP
jgi:4-aminobutyrate aminotransferase-like enzyme